MYLTHLVSREVEVRYNAGPVPKEGHSLLLNQRTTKWIRERKPSSGHSMRLISLSAEMGPMIARVIFW